MKSNDVSAGTLYLIIPFTFYNVSIPFYSPSCSRVLTIGGSLVMYCSLVADLFQSSMRIPSTRYLPHVIPVHIL
jgi:hypothetical protein